MNRLRPFSAGKRAPLIRGRGRNLHMTKRGPGRVGKHHVGEVGVKVWRNLQKQPASGSRT